MMHQAAALLLFVLLPLVAALEDPRGHGGGIAIGIEYGLVSW